MHARTRQLIRTFVRLTGAMALVAVSVLVASAAKPGPARALAACSNNAQGGYTMAASHGKVFYIDTGVNPVLDAGYIGYRFTNSSGAVQKNLWASVGNFSGGKMSLANIDDQYFKMPDMANGSTSTAYFMLKASGGTTAAQTHDVKLWDRRPDLTGATALYQCTYSFTKVQETIKAQSNKVTDNSGDSVAISASTTSPKLGETLTITVEGQTGQIGNGSVPDNSMVWLTPAAVSSWPTRALRLEAVSIVFDTNGNWSSSGDQLTYANQLFVGNAKTAVNTSEYRATYTFRVTGRPNASVKAVPVTQISSGSQVKHSDTGLAGATVDLNFSSYAINATVTKAVTSSTGLTSVDCAAGSCSAWGGLDGSSYLVVPYQLTVSTTSTTATVIDEIVDTPDAGMRYYTDASKVTKLTDVNNTNVTWSAPSLLASEASMSPRPQHFVGPFTFSSARTAVISYWMAVPKVTGTYSNTAYAMVGDSPIGASATAMSRVQVSTTGTTDVGVTNTTQSFSVVAATNPASSITTSGAVLNGSVDPNGTATLTGEFEYSTNSSFTGATTVTASTPASGNLGGLTDPTLVSYTLSGLSQFTTYWFRVKAGSAYGDPSSFTTLGTASVPTATTEAAGPTSANSAVLNGTVNPNLTTVNGVQFLYSTSPTLASGVLTLTVPDSADATIPMVLSGLSPQVVSYPIDSPGLVAGTTYYYKVRACPNGSASMTNYSCGSGFVDGSIVSFIAGTAPVVATTSLPSTLKSVSYSATLAATGGSGTYTSWSLASGSLPSGLALDTATGIISGTVGGAATTQTFTVRVTDSLKAQSAAQSLTLTVIVSKSNQSISFSAPADRSYSSDPFNVNPSASSNLPVTVVSTTPSVCDSVAATTGWDIYMLKAGTCGLTASQAGNLSYNAAPDVPVSFVISKLSQSVSYSPPNKTFGDSSFSVAPSTSAAGEGFTPTYSGGVSGVCSINPTTGEITVLGAGTCSVQADYPGNDRFNNGSSGSRTFTIAKKNQTMSLTQSAKTFGDANFPVTASTDATGAGSVTYASTTTGVCTVTSSGTVSIVTAGTCQLTAEHPGNGNWNPGNTSASFVIYRKNQTTSFTQSAKTFGDADFTASAATDVTGPGGYSYSSSTPGVCTVSSGGSVSIVSAGSCSLTADHPGNGNWNPASVSVTFAVGKKNQTASFSQSGKTFGDPNFNAGASTDATGAGAFDYTSSTPGVCTVSSGGSVSIVSAGSCSLTADHPGNGNWNPASVSVTFAVGKKNQTVLMSPSSRSIADGTYDLTSVTSTDATGAGSITYSGGDGVVCSVASNGLVTLITYGSCSVTASHPGNGNWNPGTENATFQITNRLSQTITFLQGNKVFGDLDFDVNATTDATGSGTITFVSSTPGVCTVTSSGTVTVVAAGNCSLTADHPGNSTWNSASKSVTFAVAKKSQAVSFSQGNKVFGDADFGVSASTDASGGGSFAYSSSTPGVCTVTSSGTVTVVAAGNCSLTASHPGNGNWNPGSNSVTFAVGKKNQAVSFSQGNKVFGDADFGVSASTDASGGGSFAYSSSTPGVCTVTSSGTVTVIAAGNCSLTADHPGNGNWNPGSGSVNFNVVKKSQAVSFSQGNKVFGDADFGVSASTDASGGGSFAYSSSTPGVCTVTSSGTVTVVAAGNCSLTASHPGNGNWNPGSNSVTFAVGKKNQAVSFSQGNKVFGDADFGVSASTDASGGGSFAYSSSTPGVCTVTSSGTVTVVDVGDCTVEASHPGNGNWNAGSQSSTFSIGKGTPSISMTQSNKTIGDPSFQVTATTSAATGTVTYSSSTPGVCTVTSSGTVTVVDVGDCTVVANYGGSTQWYPAATATTFSVLAVPPTTLAPSTTAAPSTTTTVPPATTTTVSLAGAGLASSATGALTGTLWVDTDRDGRKDTNEPVLPGVEVRLSSVDAAASVSAAGVSTNTATVSTTTDTMGGYSFVAVGAGTYQVAAVLPARTALTAGSLTAVIASGSSLTRDIAAVGGATAEVLVWDPVRGTPVGSARVTCAWDGPDGRAGTDDEVTFGGTSAVDGTLRLGGVPAGNYRCRGVNTDTGARSAVVPVSARISSIVPVSTKSTMTRIEIASGGLLATGVDSGGMALLAMLLLLNGIAMVMLGRRRLQSVALPS